MRLPKLTVQWSARLSGRGYSGRRATKHDHVQYVPKQHFAMTFAQVRGFTPGV